MQFVIAILNMQPTHLKGCVTSKTPFRMSVYEALYIDNSAVGFWLRCFKIHDFKVCDTISNIFSDFLHQKSEIYFIVGPVASYSGSVWSHSHSRVSSWICLCIEMQCVMAILSMQPTQLKGCVTSKTLFRMSVYEALYIDNSAVGMSMRKFCWQEILLWCHAQCSRML